jgi:NifU-like protein
LAKSDLVGGSLWEQYSDKVSSRMNNPKYMGAITEEEADRLGAKLVIADWGAEACGDAVRLYWAVDKKTDKIKKAAFKSFGCGTAIASCDMMSEMCIGKTVDEALKITNLDVEHALRDNDDTPSIPPQKMHCSVMAYDVIKKAASIYKGVDMELLDEKEMVCECARVTLGTIKDVIRVNDLKTVDEITQYTKAGAFCKSCIKPGGHEKRKYYLEDILRETREEMNREKLSHDESEPADFKSLSLIQKYKEIKKIVDNHINDKLARDNGSIEIVDIKDIENITEIYLKYKGACATCPSSRTGTLSVISNILNENTNSEIRVKIV